MVACFTFQSDEVEICFNELHICGACGQVEEQNILSLCLELVKVGGYDFPHPCYGPQNSHLFFKRPLVDTEFDMPALKVCDNDSFTVSTLCWTLPIV
jgi:hypothetical protein